VEEWQSFIFDLISRHEKGLIANISFCPLANSALFVWSDKKTETVNSRVGTFLISFALFSSKFANSKFFSNSFSTKTIDLQLQHIWWWSICMVSEWWKCKKRIFFFWQRSQNKIDEWKETTVSFSSYKFPILFIAFFRFPFLPQGLFQIAKLLNFWGS
jgi:hypothetical protein